MPDIHLLNQNTIDQIAAGEVVERPSSVVKELTENAIDAGASFITVEIKEGGISFIRVTDNGCGIGKNQIQKAFLRHATSKINEIGDLNTLGSLGFRGEALSSIASVSQMEVITKTERDLTGVRYMIAGGQEEGVEEIGAPTGTTFIVRNLFFNTPARKKFLKQPQTEGGYIADLMEHLALSHPLISIKFTNNGHVRFHTSGNGDLNEIIYRIYGREITDYLLPFHAEGTEYSITGFIGKPELVRANRGFETVFVNGRYVKNDIITKSVEEGYRTFLTQHKFPFFVLHFIMEPASIDVNVHPSKMEIRINNGKTLYDYLSVEILNCLKQQELIPDVHLTEEKEMLQAEQQIPEPFEANRIAGIYQQKEQKDRTLQEEPAPYTYKIVGTEKDERKYKSENIHDNVIKTGEHILVERPAQLNLFEDRFLTTDAVMNYKIIGQIFDTYWLIVFKDKLFIIDQHAAHEKVKYEHLIKELHNKSISSQMLNPPVILSLTGKESAFINEYHSFFLELGFEIEDFGSESYALRSIPTDLYGCNEKELFTNILDEISENPLRTNTPEDVLQKLASMACKSAVKGNNPMNMQEATALIDELLKLDNPYHCPHGRPTIISMSKYEIEKKFKRIM